MNMQFAVTAAAQPARRRRTIYILEVNPRASRTVPFVSKATGVPLARLAALVMVGKTLDELGVHDEVVPKHLLRQGKRLPVQQVPRRGHHPRPGDAIDRRSDGHRRHVSDGVRQEADGRELRRCRRAGRSSSPCRDRDKEAVVPIARSFAEMGYRLIATRGTARFLADHGIPVEDVPKIAEGRPNLIDHMKNDQVALVINTPSGRGSATG